MARLLFGWEGSLEGFREILKEDDGRFLVHKKSMTEACNLEIFDRPTKTYSQTRFILSLNFVT